MVFTQMSCKTILGKKLVRRAANTQGLVSTVKWAARMDGIFIVVALLIG
jgi:hypothetical protein